MDKRALILYNQIIINHKFVNLISEARKALNIPPNGFLKPKNSIFPKHYKESDAVALVPMVDKIYIEIEKIFPEVHNEDTGEWASLIEMYLLFNSVNLKEIDMRGCRLMPTYDGFNIHVGLNATKKDVFDFLNDNFKYIRETQIKKRLEKNLPKNKRLREMPNFERDKRIYELSKLDKKTLGVMIGLDKIIPEERTEPPVYKSTYIQRILSQENYGLVDDGTIRKIISRQKKLREK